jgi:hypothetical protein
MKKILLWSMVFIGLSAFMTTSDYRSIKNDSFQRGEQIEYLVHYLGLSAGTAKVNVDPRCYVLNNRICYRVEVLGQTVGAAGAMYKVNDTWRSYVDSTAFITHRFFRHLEENNYRREELTDFNPLTNVATMKYEQYGTKDPPNKPRQKGVKTFTAPQYAQDLVSGYYYLRTIDFNQLKEGEIITIPGVLENESYTLSIRYKGKETVRTKFGKINAHRLVPIMPKNGLFNGESSIRFWVSDDKNRVPVRIEADMFVGKVVCEIRDYKNIRHKFSFQ